MRNSIRVPVVGLLVTLAVAGSVAAQSPVESLYLRRTDPRQGMMFQDKSARYVGDTLTILIQENSDVANKDQRANSRKSTTGGSFDLSLATSGDIIDSGADAEFSTETSNSSKFDGSAQYQSARKITDRITVRVQEVDPRSGLMLVSGTRKIYVGSECRTLVVSGRVRPYDVRPDNSVESRYIDGLTVAYSGSGADTQMVRQGWLQSIMNRLRAY